MLDEGNAALLKKEGVLIWLVAGEETILKRMRRDAATAGQRPPLSSGDLRKEITDTLATRTPIYRRLADLTVATDMLGIDECVANILQALSNKG